MYSSGTFSPVNELKECYLAHVSTEFAVAPSTTQKFGKLWRVCGLIIFFSFFPVIALADEGAPLTKKLNVLERLPITKEFKALKDSLLSKGAEHPSTEILHKFRRFAEGSLRRTEFSGEVKRLEMLSIVNISPELAGKLKALLIAQYSRTLEIGRASCRERV